jgi:hypothetical protein
VLLDGALVEAARDQVAQQQGEPEPEAQAPRLSDVLGRIAELDNDQTPRAVMAAGGLVLSAVTPGQGVAGLNTSTLVRERGLEPPRPEGHQPLKLTRLPIPPLALIGINWDDYS